MIALDERTVLSILLGTIGAAALFCLIGLATPGWRGFTLFDLKAHSTAALAIISLLLLIGSLVLAVLILINALPNPHLPLIFLLLLFVSSIFVIGTVGSAFGSSASYSYNLLITSLTFTYVSSLGAVFWFFSLRNGGGQSASSTGPASAPPRIAMAGDGY